jgi:hypothetical protein
MRLNEINDETALAAVLQPIRFCYLFRDYTHDLFYREKNSVAIEQQ